MAANQITINTDAINTAKGIIERKNGELQETLNSIYRTIEDLVPQHWNGDAATETQNKMSEFKQKTQTSYNSVLADYIQFINTTVTAYEGNETNIKSNATSQMDSSAVADFV